MLSSLEPFPLHGIKAMKSQSRFIRREKEEANNVQFAFIIYIQKYTMHPISNHYYKVQMKLNFFQRKSFVNFNSFTIQVDQNNITTLRANIEYYFTFQSS